MSRLCHFAVRSDFLCIISHGTIIPKTAIPTFRVYILFPESSSVYIRCMMTQLGCSLSTTLAASWNECQDLCHWPPRCFSLTCVQGMVWVLSSLVMLSYHFNVFSYYNAVSGASLWSIIALVREPHSKTLFPSVKVVYDTDSPAISAIIVHLHPYIDLLFSGKGQRLHTIAIRHLRHGLPTSPKQAPQPLGMAVGSATSSSKSRGGGSSLILRYKHTIISSPDEVLRRAGVMKSFGPTYEGDVMKYPGVSFIFEDDASAALLRSPRLSADENKRVEVKKISITQRTVGGDEVDAFDEVLESPVMDGDLRSVVLKVSHFLRIYGISSLSIGT